MLHGIENIGNKLHCTPSPHNCVSIGLLFFIGAIQTGFVGEIIKDIGS
jgi:hypothetical protein